MTDWTLADLANVSRATDTLSDKGFSRQQALVKGQRFTEIARSLLARSIDEQAPAVAWFVPGRIEVFGKHTDYAGGRSIVAAAQRGFCGVAAARADGLVRIVDVVSDEQVEFPLARDITPAAGYWSNYPMTVVRRVAANFPAAKTGATIAFASDLPPAAGMSSSSALMVMTFLLLEHLNRLRAAPEFRKNIHSLEDLAEYLGTVENGQTFRQLAGDSGVGTFGGSEDQTAILCAQGGKWAQYAYCPVRQERLIEAPRHHQFVIGVSGVVAEKTGAARDLYNQASRRASALVQIWQEATKQNEPHLAAIVHSSPDAFARLRNLLHDHQHPDFGSQELIDRFEQFYVENEAIIPSVPDVVTPKLLGKLGKLAQRSQNLGAEQLGNQIPETVFLVQTARHLGAVAASAQGAGFGGSVWALVADQEVETFRQQWAAAYRQTFPDHADSSSFFASRPGPPATQVAGDACIRDEFVPE